MQQEFSLIDKIDKSDRWIDKIDRLIDKIDRSRDKIYIDGQINQID